MDQMQTPQMLMSMPEVAVLICTYNNADRIGDLIEDLLSQTYKKFQCYILNDGSTDETAAYLERVVGSLPKFTIITHEKNQGVGQSRLELLRLIKDSDFKYWTFIDADDRISSQYLEFLVKPLEYSGLYTSCAYMEMEPKTKFEPFHFQNEALYAVVDLTESWIKDNVHVWTPLRSKMFSIRTLEVLDEFEPISIYEDIANTHKFLFYQQKSAIIVFAPIYQKIFNPEGVGKDKPILEERYLMKEAARISRFNYFYYKSTEFNKIKLKNYIDLIALFACRCIKPDFQKDFPVQYYTELQICDTFLSIVKYRRNSIFEGLLPKHITKDKEELEFLKERWDKI